MTTSPAPSNLARLDFYGPPPLLEGEDSAAYNELLMRVSLAVKPADVLEGIWVEFIVGGGMYLSGNDVTYRRPTRGGFTEIRSGVLIRRPHEASASCADHASL